MADPTIPSRRISALGISSPDRVEDPSVRQILREVATAIRELSTRLPSTTDSGGQSSQTVVTDVRMGGAGETEVIGRSNVYRDGKKIGEGAEVVIGRFKVAVASSGSSGSSADITALQEAVAALQADVADLDDRVTALEAEGTGNTYVNIGGWTS